MQHPVLQKLHNILIDMVERKWPKRLMERQEFVINFTIPSRRKKTTGVQSMFNLKSHSLCLSITVHYSCWEAIQMFYLKLFTKWFPCLSLLSSNAHHLTLLPALMAEELSKRNHGSSMYKLWAIVRKLQLNKKRYNNASINYSEWMRGIPLNFIADKAIKLLESKLMG